MPPSRIMAFLASVTVPAFAAVSVNSLSPSVPSPQVIGTSITWTAKATAGAGAMLTFQFNVGASGKPLSMIKDFNVGVLSGGVYTSQPFVWVPTGPEGTYHVQVVVKDFTSGQTASKSATYSVTPLVTGSSPVAVATANPLVALFSAPACPAGSKMRAAFHQTAAGSPVTDTYWAPCDGTTTMSFEIAGMYPSTGWSIHAQTNTAGKITNGPNVKFTTGPLPAGVAFPKFTVLVPAGSQTDTSEPVLLWGLSQLGGESNYRDVATDLKGKINWFYNTPETNSDILTRPVLNGGAYTIQTGASWNTVTQAAQLLRQIDAAGNIVKETNTGVIQQQLLALGSVDGGPCTTISQPPPIGAACLGAFHHELTALPNGYVAALGSIEKIYPPGTQGDTTGLPVDIVGDVIVVMNSQWQVVWYWDAFQFLNVNQAAVLGETCTATEAGCPPLFLLTAGISPYGKDWLHANSIYYWPQSSDLILSMKDQDTVIKIDYNNGAGTGTPLWYMTWQSNSNFNFLNVFGDPWPWFSHQHDVTMANNGAGPMLVFDNGDTRISPPPLGLGYPGCEPNDCNSRGMALTVDESNFTVQPVLSVNLGNYSAADGAAQLLSNGNYFFHSALIVGSGGVNSQAMEFAGSTLVLNVQGPQSYRGWQLASLYSAN